MLGGALTRPYEKWGTPFGVPVFLLAAAAAVVVVAATAQVVTIAAAAEQQDQDDDPPAVVATTEAVIVAHNTTSKEVFSRRFAVHSMLFPLPKNVRRKNPPAALGSYG